MAVLGGPPAFERQLHVGDASVPVGGCPEAARARACPRTHAPWSCSGIETWRRIITGKDNNAKGYDGGLVGGSANESSREKTTLISGACCERPAGCSLLRTCGRRRWKRCTHTRHAPGRIRQPFRTAGVQPHHRPLLTLPRPGLGIAQAYRHHDRGTRAIRRCRTRKTSPETVYERVWTKYLMRLEWERDPANRAAMGMRRRMPDDREDWNRMRGSVWSDIRRRAQGLDE